MVLARRIVPRKLYRGSGFDRIAEILCTALDRADAADAAKLAADAANEADAAKVGVERLRAAGGSR